MKDVESGIIPGKTHSEVVPFLYQLLKFHYHWREKQHLGAQATFPWHPYARFWAFYLFYFSRNATEKSQMLLNHQQLLKRQNKINDCNPIKNICLLNSLGFFTAAIFTDCFFTDCRLQCTFLKSNNFHFFNS